jgi:hypothetical protein
MMNLSLPLMVMMLMLLLLLMMMVMRMLVCHHWSVSPGDALSDWRTDFFSWSKSWLLWN